MRVRSLVGSLIASAGLLAWAPNASAELVMVRVVREDVSVKMRPSRIAETLAKPQRDTVLEVLSREGSWFWVLVERDTHGTQRAGWVRESDVEFIDSKVARFFPAPMPPPSREEQAVEEVAADAVPVDAAAPIEATPVEASAEETAAAETIVAEAAGPDAVIVAAQAKLQAEEKVEQPRPVQVAKAEKPKKVDDRKLRKAAADYEKALQAYEKLQFRALAADPFAPVGEPIVEPLYSLPD
jgi:hypothetical protein